MCIIYSASVIGEKHALGVTVQHKTSCLTALQYDKQNPRHLNTFATFTFK